MSERKSFYPLKHLLYRDPWILVIDKPAGMPVHAGPRGGDNLEKYFEELRFERKQNPFLAHRLDRDTSGCLVLGRHKQALRRMGELFSSGQVQKTYWAIVHGVPPAEKGMISLPLKKISRRDGGWRMIVAPDGQIAITEYRVLGRSSGEETSWIEFKPQTGRTHQLRVHITHLGCPILGDGHYGDKKDIMHRLHLHARSLLIPLYEGRPAIRVVAPLPEDLQAAFQACGYRKEEDSDGRHAPDSPEIE